MMTSPPLSFCVCVWPVCYNNNMPMAGAKKNFIHRMIIIKQYIPHVFIAFQ